MYSLSGEVASFIGAIGFPLELNPRRVISPPDIPALDLLNHVRVDHENFVRKFRDFSGNNLAAGDTSVVNHAVNTVLPLTVTYSRG